MSITSLFSEEQLKQTKKTLEEFSDLMARIYAEMLIRRIAEILFFNGKKHAKSKKGVKMTINELLKRARKDSGLTMEQVAEEANVSPASVCRYEKDDRKVSLSYLRYWVLKGLKINWEDLEIENK